MFGFLRKQAEIAPAPIDNKKTIERSLDEIRGAMNEIRSTLTASMHKLSENQAALQILRDRASELEDAINTANTLSSSLSGADKARYDNLVSIATRELEHNTAQQEELGITISQRQTFIAKTREIALTLESRLVEFQSTVDTLRVRQSTAAIETKINNAASTLQEFRRDVFVTEAMAELTR
jgi:chromosome segregation ATPase